MSLALAFLAVVGLPAATGAVVSRTTEVRAFDRISSPWGTAATTARLMNLRGGGVFGGGKKSAARIYRESLEEQVLLLNEQLGHARTEVATLRENAKKRHQAGNSLHRAKQPGPSKEDERANKEYAKTEEKLEKQRQKDQKEALSRLQKEIKQLEQMKAELEKISEISASKIEALEEQLATQESLTVALEVSYQDKIAKMEQKLADVQRAQLEKLTEIHQQKIDIAVQEALRAQEAEFRARMEETTKRLTKEHAREMEQEKLRSSKAVETERKKMRKLVRALALREKKLQLQSPVPLSSSKNAKEETTAKTSVKTGSSSQKKQFTMPTNGITILL